MVKLAASSLHLTANGNEFGPTLKCVRQPTVTKQNVPQGMLFNAVIRVTQFKLYLFIYLFIFAKNYSVQIDFKFSIILKNN